MKFRISAAVMFALFLLLSAGTLRADGTGLLSYTLTGPTDVTFEIPASPTPTAFGDGFGFFVDPTNFMIGGVPAPSGDFIEFVSTSNGGEGGLLDFDGFFSTMGPQLYKGLESAPMMTVFSGPVALVDFFNPSDGGYTLTVKQVTSPEPSSLFLMGVGLLSFFFLRRIKATT